VERVEADERLGADFEPAKHPEAGLGPKHGRRTGDARAHRDRPEGQLVPRQEVAGKAQEEGEHQEDDADHPVELAWRFVGARIEHPHHVQEDEDDHRVGHPTVQVAHQLPELDGRGDVLHVEVGAVDARHVIEHEQDAGDGEAQEHEEREAAEAVRVRDLDVRAMDAGGVEVEEHVGRDHEHLVAGRVRVAGAEDRLPHVVVEHLVVDLVRECRLRRCFNGHGSLYLCHHWPKRTSRARVATIVIPTKTSSSVSAKSCGRLANSNRPASPSFVPVGTEPRCHRTL